MSFSTMMKMILGLIAPDGGQIDLAGHVPGSAVARALTAYLPENVAFSATLTGRETLRFFCRLRGESLGCVDALLEQVGLEPGGQRGAHRADVDGPVQERQVAPRHRHAPRPRGHGVGPMVGVSQRGVAREHVGHRMNHPVWPLKRPVQPVGILRARAVFTVCPLAVAGLESCPGKPPIFPQNTTPIREPPMAADTLTEFTDANFQAEALDADVPVLVDFWAEWCMPCRMLAPVIEKIAESYGDKIKVGKLDTDANRETAVKYGISSIPTVMLFHKGEMVKQVVGMQPEGAYTAEVDKVLG